MLEEADLVRRITELQLERDGYTVNAQAQITAYNAVIGELERQLSSFSSSDSESESQSQQEQKKEKK